MRRVRSMHCVAAVYDRRQLVVVERLHRLERLHIENPIYFVTFCTHSRKQLLNCRSVHQTFEEFCTAAVEHGIFVGRYILMPDHVHLFVKVPPPSDNLSKWMKSLKNTVSKQLRSGGCPAPHWQKGFFEHVLRSQESCSQKWQYVVENSLRKQLAETVEDWPYQGEVHPLAVDEELRRS